MGFLDRLHKIAVAAGGSTKAILGFTLGLPASSLKDDEYDSFIGHVYANVVDHAKELAGSVLGPTGVATQVAGTLPETIRHPIRQVSAPITSGIETAYREGVSEPLSTYFTTLSQADSYGGQRLLSPTAWSRSYRIAQHRSPGQALAIGLSQTNPLDEAEVDKFAGTDAYKVISGMADAVSRTFLDPTVLAGKAATAARLAYVTKPITEASDIVDLANSPRVAKFNQAIWDIKKAEPKAAAAIIRNRFFPDHEAGALISTVLAEAKTPVEQHFAIKALMGDAESLDRLDEARSTLHESIASLNRQADQLGPIKAMGETKYEGTIVDPLHTRGPVGDPALQGTLFGVTPSGIPGDIADLRERVSRYYDADQRLARMQAGWATIKTVPKAGPIGEIRSAITRSDFYQHTTLGKTLQTFFHMNAHPVMVISDPRSDIAIHRLLQESELPQDLADSFRASYMKAPDDATRLQVAISAERTAVAHVASQAGMNVEEIQGVLNDIAKGRGEATDMLTKRVFNADGSSVLTHQDIEGNWVDTYFPPWVTQESTLLPLINMRELKSAATQIGEFRARFPSTAIPAELATKFTRIWKPAVLLRPAWPIRVVGDEQFRIIAKIGALSHLDNLRTGLRDYTTDFISAARERGISEVVGKENRAVRQSFAVREYNTHGIDMEGVFGTPEDVRRNFRQLVSSSRSWEALVGDAEKFELKEMRTAGANFKSVNPDHADYPALYNWAVDHLRKQPIAKRLLAGESPEDVINWLHSTPEGTDLLRANTVRAHNARNWVEDIDREVTKYTADNPELRDIIAGRDPRLRTSPLPPTAPNLPTLYHGTPKPITRLADYEGRSSENLFGPGFYTTDNPAVAEQYFLKGKRPSDKPLMYSAQHAGPVNVLDMEGPLPTNLRQPLKDSMLGAIAHMDTTASEYDELVRLLDEGTGADIYKQFKTVLAHADPPQTRAAVDEILTDLNEAVFADRGIDAFRYRGGVRTGNLEHNAYVFLKPSNLTIAEVPKRAAITGPYEYANLTPHEQLARLVPDIHARPVAHGEALLQATNQGYISKRVGQIVANTFDKLGRLPTDTLSRNPFMGHMYRAEIDRQLSLLGDRPITDALKGQIESRAREFALNETEKLLYDLAESSRFGEMLNFISPFYNAWQEVLTRWTGLAIENPEFIARARLIWRAPEKMGLVTDEDGREIKSGETYSDIEGTPGYRGKDRIIHLPLPSWAKDIPYFGKGLSGKDTIGFNKKSFNLILQGLPSTGPLVAVPVNELVKNRPDLADNVKFILPYGPTFDLKSMLLPASAKYLASASEQDQKYQNALLRIYFDKVTDYNLGKRDTKPTFQEAEDEATRFTHLRSLASAVLPASPVFQSPYQLYIDAFRQAQARYSEDKNALADSHGNARTPDEYFLDTYGKEYFALTQAVSKSLNGVPPTLDAWMASKKNAELIQQFPELGGLIIGADGGGEFNAAVYNAQKNTKLSPSSNETQREPIPFDEASTDPERRLGWIEYRRAMDLLEATRIQRGLPNLQVAAASDLAAAKSAVTAYLSSKYPAWKDDFNQTDSGKWQKKIAALATISADPSMKDREDMKGIRDYLYAREQFNKALADRASKGGAKTLNASSNQDLAEAWHAVTGTLIERNLAFADVFYRHLENDPLGL